MTHVRNDSYNLAFARTKHEPFTDRVFIREIAARQRLAYENDFWRIRVIAFRRLAAPDQSNAHSPKVIGSNRVVPRHGFMTGFRRRLTLDSEFGVGAAAA